MHKVVFYSTEIDTLLDMTDEERGRIVGAVFAECRGKELPPLSTMETAVFKLIVAQVRRAGELSEKRRESVNKRYKNVQNSTNDVQNSTNAYTITNTNTNTSTITNTSTKEKSADAPLSLSLGNEAPTKSENCKTIIDYLNEKVGTAFKASSRDTQKHINARLAEGFTVEDFKTVIDKKCTEWKGTEWAKYLRPMTLFGSKFESYLNSETVKPKGQDTSDGGKWCSGSDPNNDWPF